MRKNSYGLGLDIRHHYLYRITNVVNGRYYIGRHSTNNLFDGYKGSGRDLWFEQMFYGPHNFKFELLKFCSAKKSLKYAEGRYLRHFIDDPLCLNVLNGTLPKKKRKKITKSKASLYGKRKILSGTTPRSTFNPLKSYKT